MRWTNVLNAICGATQMENGGNALTVGVRVKNKALGREVLETQSTLVLIGNVHLFKFESQ